MAVTLFFFFFFLATLLIATSPVPSGLPFPPRPPSPPLSQASNSPQATVAVLSPPLSHGSQAPPPPDASALPPHALLPLSHGSQAPPSSYASALPQFSGYPAPSPSLPRAKTVLHSTSSFSAPLTPAISRLARSSATTRICIPAVGWIPCSFIVAATR